MAERIPTSSTASLPRSPKVRASGAEVFVDEGQVTYGNDFRERVFRELTICDELLVLLTPSSVKRP
jgi:hypothetical protein